MDFGIQTTQSLVCAPGFTLESERYVPCQTGFYKELASNAPCSSCKKTAVKNSVLTSIPAISRSNCICSKDDFLNPLNPDNSSFFIGECIECPKGTNCDREGVSLEELPVLPGYWRSGTTSFVIEQCLIADACPQQTNSSNSSQICSAGHQGILCSVCQPDYSMGVLGVCEICVSSNNIPVETIKFFAIVIGGAILVLTTMATIQHFKSAKKEKNKINGAERISQFRRRARTTSNVDSKSESSALLDLQQDRSNWFNRGRTKVKILLSFYQIVGQFENVLNIRFPLVFEKFTRRISAFANFDSLRLMNVGCVIPTSFYTKVIVSTLLPIFLAILILLWWYISSNLGHKTKC